MISGFAGYQQSSAVSLFQVSSENGAQQKSPAPGPRNVLGAVQAHSDGARQAFDKASSQILTSFLDGLQNKISEEPNKGANDAGSITSLSTAEFESSLAVSSSFSNGQGTSAAFDMEAFAGLSFELEEVDGKLTGFSLDFEMETNFSFAATNGYGGARELSYSNVQSFSISFSLSEDENGNTISELSFERSEVTQASFMAFGDQSGLGVGSVNDIASFMDGNGTSGQMGPPPPPPGSVTAESTVQMSMESALEILKSITEYEVEETTTSLFSNQFYDEDY